MPASPSELLRSANSTLNALAEHFDAVDAIEEKARNAKTQLDALVQELNRVSAKLNSTKVELVKAEDTLAKKYHIINDEKARALRDIDEQIAARLQQVKKLDLQIREKREEHMNVIAGMDALVKRLRV